MRRSVLVVCVIALLTLVITTLTSASEFKLAPETKEKIYFRGWQYKTHIVEDNVARYNKEMGGNVDYATITGDYPSLMETQLATGAQLDILYGNPSSACRYFDGGWVLPIDEMPNAAEIKAALYPNLLKAWTYKGKLLGLPYFVTTRGAIHVNLKKYKEAGLTDADFPATWDELYDQLYVLRDRGFKKPFLPHWFAEWYGINWAFIFEVMNRGGRVADPVTHKPLLTVDGPGGETLRDWKRIWKDGLVPQEVLTYRESDYLEAWGSGEYVMSPQQMYDLKKFNDPRYSKFAGYCSLLPYKGQSWGLIDSALYIISNRKRSAAHTRDVMRFASWYGYRDHKGEIFVGQRWMDESMLFSGYKEVMESAKTKEGMKGSLSRSEDYKAVLEVYANTPYPDDVFNVVWADEFGSFLRETLANFLTQDRPVDKTIQAINDKIVALNKKYGIK